MLSERQLHIIEYFLQYCDSYITANMIATHFKVSMRTIFNDLEAIKEYGKKYASFEIITSPGKGTRIKILNEVQLKKDLHLLKNNSSYDYANANNRSKLIIKYLLNNNGYTPKYDLMEQFSISETTLYTTIRELKTILKEFSLQLEYKTNHGYAILGSELKKRTCINKIGMDYEFDSTAPESTNAIYTIVADVFIKYQYHIDESTLQNITSYVSLSLQRIKHFHFIEQPSDLGLKQTKEFIIAKDILHTLVNRNKLPEDYFYYECMLLTQIILGRLDYTGEDLLQEEVNAFIDRAFHLIFQKFSINFDAVDNLKLVLALHVVPLFYRIKSGTQLTNPQANEIHLSFTHAYDIALFFSVLIEKEFGLTVSIDEISYLALYFNFGLENYISTTKGKKILIITSLRKSEMILLKHKIFNNIPNQIEIIDFTSWPITNTNISVENYDGVFTTEQYLEEYQNVIPKINLFPSEQDFKKITMTIQGYNDIHAVLTKFSEERFFYGSVSSKDEALKIVIDNINCTYHLGDEFVKSVYNRENLSSSYFGNHVAIPHPLTPMSEETLVSVALLQNEVYWDEEHAVRIILLVSIAKNNIKELQFWHYLSIFLENDTLFHDIFATPTFSNFITCVEHALKIM